MALLRFESELDPIVSLQRELERFLRNPAISLGVSGYGAFPPINVLEDAEGMVVVVELPGLSPSEVNVSSKGRTLSLSGECKPSDGNQGSYHRRERRFGVFSRSIQLPEDLDLEKANAKCEAGLLTIRVPKAESAKPRQISVQAEKKENTP